MPSMNSGAHQLLMDFNILKLHIPPPDKTTNLGMTQVSFDPLHPQRRDRQSKTVQKATIKTNYDRVI